MSKATGIKSGLGIAAAIAAFAFAPALTAAQATVIPPGNSAAAQYTEAIPTGGGDKATGADKKERSPAKVLGARKAKSLAAHGSDGHAVAEVVATTAPAPVVPPEPSADTPVPSRSHPLHSSPPHEPVAAGRSSKSGGKPARHRVNLGAPAHAAAPMPSGNSGLGSVLGQATGSSSGELGWFLPLAVLAAILWSLAYLWRQRQRPV